MSSHMGPCGACGTLTCFTENEVAGVSRCCNCAAAGRPVDPRHRESETTLREELRVTKLAEEVWRRQANEARGELAIARGTLETTVLALEKLQEQMAALERTAEGLRR